jgi:protease-4
MRKFLLGLLVGFLFCVLALVVVLFAAVRFANRPPSIPENAVLMLKLQGEMPESPGIEVPFPLPFLQTAPPTVKDYWELLRKAAADSRIRAVVFQPQGVQAGWGKLEEIRQDIEAFRRNSHKPVYAFLRAPGAREYYMATAADRVILAPEDYLDLKGLRAELMYVKGLLDKIGVQVEIEHAGKYKDAGDMFTRTSMSPETREVMNSVLDGLYGELVGRLAAGRKKSPDQMRAIIDQGPFTSQAALQAGLVDGLEYEDQVFDELKSRLKVPEVRKVAVGDYLHISPQSLGIQNGRRIALVAAEGDIIRGEGESPLGGEGFITSGGMTRLLRQVRNDDGIKGALVRIDSPGGDGFASDEIWREMVLLSRRKPVVISMSDLAASGGYYIAMTGDPVLAYPATFTGSIGVFYGKADLRGLYNKLGINKELLTRGQFAAIDSDYSPLSPAARQKLLQSIETFYGTFVSRVAQGRHKPPAAIEPIAQGRVWLGSQAKQNGLIDNFGGLDQALALLKQKARIPAGEDVQVVIYPPKRSLFEELLGRRESVALPTLLRRYTTKTWANGGFFYLMPYQLELR